MKVAGTDVQCQSEPIHTGRTVKLDHYRALLVRINQIGFRLAVATVEVAPVLIMDEVKR